MLENAALALLVATIIQTVIKPLLPATFDNNLTRAMVGTVAYCAVVLNAAAGNHLGSFSDAWSLIPQAGAVAAGAISTYHILSDIVTKPNSPNIPPIELEGPVKTLAIPPAIVPSVTTGSDTTTTTAISTPADPTVPAGSA